MRFSRVLLLTLLILGGCSCKSWAEIVRWSDPDTGVRLNYPDRWERVHNQQPGDVLSIAAPGAKDFAGCTLGIHEDRRFLIYPQEYGRYIQKANYGQAFWDDYLARYDNAHVTKYHDGGFGRGFGSVAEVSYETPHGTKMRRRGLVAVALYVDKAYVLECSSAEWAFGKWYPGFAQIMQSVSFEKLIHGHPNGEYRNFIGDPLLVIHGRTTKDAYVQ